MVRHHLRRIHHMIKMMVRQPQGIDFYPQPAHPRRTILRRINQQPPAPGFHEISVGLAKSARKNIPCHRNIVGQTRGRDKL